jgi:hypothetical protein
VELAQAIQSCRYWQLRIKQLKGRLVAQNTLERMRIASGLPPTATTGQPLSALLYNYKTACDHVTACQTNHVELREKYLEGLADAIISKWCPFLDAPRRKGEKQRKIAHEIRGLIKRECRRNMYQQIKSTIHPPCTNHGGLSRIDIPSSSTEPFLEGPDPKTWCGEWTSITQPEDIAKHLCSMNACQYNQAAETPFANSPLVDIIGPEANTTEAHHILQGQLPGQELLEGLQPETIQILQQLATPKTMAPLTIESNILPDEFISTYKAMHERISSSPSGRHVGHYKAACQDPSIAYIHSRMMSILFLAGFSPRRWRKVIDVMLEKGQGYPRVHRLHIITLLESDFNHALHILIGRQLGFRMEDNNLVPDMQYGSREGRQCISAIIKQTTYT